MALVGEDNIEGALALPGHAREGTDHVAQHACLGLASARRADGDVLELSSHRGIVVLGVLVRNEETREVCHQPHCEPDEQHQHERVDRVSIVRRSLEVRGQLREVDGAVWEAVLQGRSLVQVRARVRAPACDREAPVVERRRRHCLRELELEAVPSIHAAVHSARDKVQRSTRRKALIRLERDFVHVPELHRIPSRVSNSRRRRGVFVVRRLICSLYECKQVWRWVSDSVVHGGVLVQPLPGATNHASGASAVDVDARREHIGAGHRVGAR
mmetsp:Transcript_1156/g.3219  ORF Transcript_1156/g.3219 Transcript_1156/m.3219 type:complete len:271 (-) Transcript_1156:1442-2254(-)